MINFDSLPEKIKVDPEKADEVNKIIAELDEVIDRLEVRDMQASTIEDKIFKYQEIIAETNEYIRKSKNSPDKHGLTKLVRRLTELEAELELLKNKYYEVALTEKEKKLITDYKYRIEELIDNINEAIDFDASAN